MSTLLASTRPRLSRLAIWNMCVGFFGIQIGFGLQNANTSRIFQSLGAEVDSLAILWIAAPLTGLLVQPIIGHFSDRTWTRFGRRRPYFLVGAIAGLMIAIPAFFWANRLLPVGMSARGQAEIDLFFGVLAVYAMPDTRAGIVAHGGEDRVEIGPGHRRLDTAQQIIAAQSDDHGIGFGRDRPVQPRQAPCRGIARDACVDQRHLGPLGIEPGLQLRHQSFAFGQAIACGQAVTQRHDGDGFGAGRDGNEGRKRYSHCRQCDVAEPAARAISGFGQLEGGFHGGCGSGAKGRSVDFGGKCGAGRYPQGHITGSSCGRDGGAGGAFGFGEVVASDADGGAGTRHLGPGA